MAPTKTIYVKESDLPLWGRFENAVKEWNAAESVSALLTEAMRHYLNQFGDQGGGLYVETPDGEPATFGGGTTAILAPQRDGWLLSLDEDEFGDSMYQGYPLGRAGVEEALKEARRCMADALKDNEVHQAARRLRDAVGEEEIIDKSVGWAAGREWALHRAVPGELDGVLELAGQHWISFGGRTDDDSWSTLYDEMDSLGHTDPGERRQISRNPFMGAFIDAAAVAYREMLAAQDDL